MPSAMFITTSLTQMYIGATARWLGPTRTPGVLRVMFCGFSMKTDWGVRRGDAGSGSFDFPLSLEAEWMTFPSWGVKPSHKQAALQSITYNPATATETQTLNWSYFYCSYIGCILWKANWFLKYFFIRNDLFWVDLIIKMATEVWSLTSYFTSFWLL